MLLYRLSQRQLVCLILNFILYSVLSFVLFGLQPSIILSQVQKLHPWWRRDLELKLVKFFFLASVAGARPNLLRCSLRSQQAESRSEEAEVEHRPMAAQEEQNREERPKHQIAVRPAAGNTGSKRRNSDSRRMQHRGPVRHSIGRIERHSRLGCSLPGVLVFLEGRRPMGIERLRMSRIRRRNPDSGGRRLAGSRNRAAGEGSL